MPFTQSLKLTSSAPYQLSVAGGAFNTAIKIAIVNPANSTQAIISLGSGYALVSGSALGTVTEGSNLKYLIRKNSDGAEFEINVNFSVDVVFDNMGIIIQGLSGRLCKAGSGLVA
jgi:hypothetical protein